MKRLLFILSFVLMICVSCQKQDTAKDNLPGTTWYSISGKTITFTEKVITSSDGSSADYSVYQNEDALVCFSIQNLKIGDIVFNDGAFKRSLGQVVLKRANGGEVEIEDVYYRKK